MAHSQLIRVQVLSSPLVKDVMVRCVLLMAIRSHGPDGILEAHWWPFMWCRVKRLRVSARVDNGNEMMLPLEEGLIAAKVNLLKSERPEF